MSDHNGVDIAPEDIRQIEMEIETIDPNRQFQAVVVKMDRFEMNPICPHCRETELPELLKSFNESHGEFVGDILLCKRCEGIIISLRYPIFAYSTPIHLNWKIKP